MSRFGFRGAYTDKHQAQGYAPVWKKRMWDMAEGELELTINMMRLSIKRATAHSQRRPRTETRLKAYLHEQASRTQLLGIENRKRLILGDIEKLKEKE